MVTDLNLLLNMVTSGVLTKEEGVNELASFICNNYKVFGLQKFDEDFRNDIILSLLESGQKIFTNYKPENGDFFNYIYCVINGKIKTSLKNKAKEILNERFSYHEAVSGYSEKCCKYDDLSIYNNIHSKIPYKNKQITAEQLQEGLKSYKLEKYDRSILFLAIRASYDLNDRQIIKIAKLYKIDLELFYDLIQFMREYLIPKKERLDECVQRRNTKYYKHKKYVEEINFLKENHNPVNKIKAERLEHKDLVQKHELEMSNQKFEDGFIYLRPPTRVIAQICNISERQINYYLHCVKNKKIDPELLNQIINDEDSDEEKA